MSTIDDYLNKKYDILAFQPGKNRGPTSQELAAYGGSGLICTGVQKLAQRWVLEFLTPKGTMPYKTQRGCLFIPHLISGNIRTNVDVTAFFSSASVEVAENLKSEESSEDDADERYSDVNLDSFSIGTDGKLTLSVTLASKAGSTRSIILPIPVAPGIG
jgi:hypothetical protein